MTILARTITLAAVASVCAAGVALGQSGDDRRRLEERLRELRTQLHDVQRQLTALRFDDIRVDNVPRVLTLTQNRARMGVVVQTPADESSDGIGARLTSVVDDSPAGEAGLRAGDIITRVNGEPLTGRYPPAGPDESEPARKLVDLVREMEEGDEVQVEYVRDGETHSTTVTLRRLDSRAAWDWLSHVSDPYVSGVTVVGPQVDGMRLFADGGGVISLISGPWSDMELVTLNEGLGTYFGVSEGLLVIKPPERSSGLHAGDVILNINGRDVPTPSRAMRILRTYEAGETITLDIMRAQQRQTVTITAPETNSARFRPRFEYWH